MTDLILSQYYRQRQAGQCRFTIRKMLDQYGPILNVWPEPCQQEYYRLAKMLRWLENDHGDEK